MYTGSLGQTAMQYEQHQQSCALAAVAAKVLLALQETAASYGLGAVGSLVYLRMLNRSIDSVGGMGAALSQPRLLVPVILTATFNRYDEGISHANHNAYNTTHLPSRATCKPPLCH